MKKKNDNPKPEMTRKEALATLHKLYDQIGWQFCEDRAFREQVQSALRTLDVAIHGKQASVSGFGFGLCRICYLRYSACTVLLKGDTPSARPCCILCFARLREEQLHECIEDVQMGAIAASSQLHAHSHREVHPC